MSWCRNQVVLPLERRNMQTQEALKWTDMLKVVNGEVKWGSNYYSSRKGPINTGKWVAYAYLQTQIQTHAHIDMHVGHLHTYMHTTTGIYTHTRILRALHMHLCTYMCTYIYISVHTCMHTDIYLTHMLITICGVKSEMVFQVKQYVTKPRSYAPSQMH